MGRIVVPILLGVALAALAVGVCLPMVTTDRIVGETSTYSVLSGIADLFGSGETGLAVLIFCFSVLFPAGKLLVLVSVWFFRPGPRVERPTLSLIAVLGKWSMLDFFVVLLLASALELGIVASTSALVGTYVFGGAILLSMIVTYLVSAQLRGNWSDSGASWPGRVPALFVVLVPLTAILFWRAIRAPLMKLEKWWFWENEYSILGGGLDLWYGESTLLGGALLLFVVILPALALVGWWGLAIASRFVHPLPENLSRGFLAVEEWAMADVFALAVFVVATKISGVVGFEAREGLWLLGVTGVLFIVVSAWGRRALRREA